MTRRKVFTTLAAVAALGAAGYASGAGSESPADVGVCVKPNGQLRVVTPENPCVIPEELQRWTVHGVEAVEPGPGLVGGNLGGIASLRVDPALIEQANAGRILAGFDDGPGSVADLTRRLPLPGGAYAITAKLTVTSSVGQGFPSIVGCTLAAGGDFDESRVVVSAGTDIFDVADATQILGLTLEVVHRFTENGDAVLSCHASGCPPFSCAPPHYEDLKIVAIRAGSLSNRFLG